MVTRGRVWPTTTRPSRWQRSIWSISSGGLKPMFTLIASRTFRSVSSPRTSSDKPCIRRLGRREYCSHLSRSSSTFVNLSSSSVIFASFSLNWEDRVATVVLRMSILLESYCGNIVSLSLDKTLSSVRSSKIWRAI